MYIVKVNIFTGNYCYHELDGDIAHRIDIVDFNHGKNMVYVVTEENLEEFIDKLELNYNERGN